MTACSHTAGRRQAALTPLSDSFCTVCGFSGSCGSPASPAGVLSGTRIHTRAAMPSVIPVKTQITPRKAVASSSGVAADASRGSSAANTATEAVATSAARRPRPPSSSP